MHVLFSSSTRRALPALLFVAACAGPVERAESVRRVDDLLAHVESVQVECRVSKEKARAGLDQLSTICSPTFRGDAKDAYAQLLDRIESSEEQARRLRASIEPMRMSAESVFRQWTADLESFGSTRMRQRSQMRLDETQARYRTVYATAQSALISYDAFNGDLRDHALFLSHDMNVSAVAELSGDVKLLRDVLAELDGRMDACAAAARTYVESAALYGQPEAAGTEGATGVSTTETPAQESTPADGTMRRSSTLKRRSATTTPSTTETTPAPVDQGPIGPPAPAPESAGTTTNPGLRPR